MVGDIYSSYNDRILEMQKVWYLAQTLEITDIRPTLYLYPLPSLFLIDIRYTLQPFLLNSIST